MYHQLLHQLIARTPNQHGKYLLFNSAASFVGLFFTLAVTTRDSHTFDTQAGGIQIIELSEPTIIFFCEQEKGNARDDFVV